VLGVLTADTNMLVHVLFGVTFEMKQGVAQRVKIPPTAETIMLNRFEKKNDYFLCYTVSPVDE
jgi:hypothetical protein